MKCGKDATKPSDERTLKEVEYLLTKKKGIKKATNLLG